MRSPIALEFNLPFQEAIAAMESRGVVLPQEYYSVLQELHRQLSFSIAGVSAIDQLQAVLDTLTQVLENGETFAEWQKNIDVKNLGLSKGRLDNIMRTNLQGAVNRGRWQQFQENKDDMPFLLYDAINDSRTRPSHSAMDGIIRKIDDPFWNTHYCPNGFRCRCRAIPLTESQANRRSKDGTGLNQKIDESVKPDKGWDYNVGKDLTAGVKNAIQERRDNSNIEPKLLNTLELILKSFENKND